MYKIKETEVKGEMVDGASGASIKWLLHKGIGVPNYEMRILEVEPQGQTPEHQHHWEHEVYVLSGTGKVRSGKGEGELMPGVAVFVPPYEKHVFLNDGEVVLKFICVIPRRIG
ncbi:MAG: hypothetical protein DDT40_00726 [candidate division WS2 bacterium]|uniref:Cupin type-2 domain-containing protein n=1 Tax=Psychracetigena formicireducens TaxID=2986056 RepID=A0A9E2BFD3_PSYF1|nr:hypothetical protein [Candidatus Psychracetigena formicireducens]MBT9150554.1 hypothetical protein [Candidatus Psychracetigena formicireducens]